MNHLLVVLFLSLFSTSSFAGAFSDCVAEGNTINKCINAHMGYQACREAEGSVDKCINAMAGFRDCFDVSKNLDQCVNATPGFRSCFEVYTTKLGATVEEATRHCISAKAGFGACVQKTNTWSVCDIKLTNSVNGCMKSKRVESKCERAKKKCLRNNDDNEELCEAEKVACVEQGLQKCNEKYATKYKRCMAEATPVRFCRNALGGFGSCYDRLGKDYARKCINAREGFSACINDADGSTNNCINAKVGFAACRSTGNSVYKCVNARMGFASCLNKTGDTYKCINAKMGFAECFDKTNDAFKCINAGPSYLD